MRRTTTYPDGSQNAVPGYGGFQAVATVLSDQPPYAQISRQGVYSWWKRRDSNGFPDMVKVARATDRLEGYAFNLEKTKVWYAQLQVKRAARKIELESRKK